MTAPANKSKGGSLAWAWRLIDRSRARENIDGNQIAHALAAIANVTGRAPIANSLPYEFDGEAELRTRHAPK